MTTLATYSQFEKRVQALKELKAAKAGSEDQQNYPEYSVPIAPVPPTPDSESEHLLAWGSKLSTSQKRRAAKGFHFGNTLELRQLKTALQKDPLSVWEAEFKSSKGTGRLPLLEKPLTYFERPNTVHSSNSWLDTSCSGPDYPSSSHYDYRSTLSSISPGPEALNEHTDAVSAVSDSSILASSPETRNPESNPQDGLPSPAVRYTALSYNRASLLLLLFIFAWILFDHLYLNLPIKADALHLHGYLSDEESNYLNSRIVSCVTHQH